MTTKHSSTVDEGGPVDERQDVVVLPTSDAKDAGLSVAELLSSFYLWLVLWLVAWAAVPAIVIGWEPVLITSGSMGPSITTGDLILIGEPATDEVLAPGTVITFRSPAVDGALITHRIDGVRDDGRYRTRGDANDQPDSDPVDSDDIVGVGRMLVPLVGLPIQWLRSDMPSFVLFVLGTAAAASSALATHRTGERRRARRAAVIASIQATDATFSPDADRAAEAEGTP